MQKIKIKCPLCYEEVEVNMSLKTRTSFVHGRRLHLTADVAISGIDHDCPAIHPVSKCKAIHPYEGYLLECKRPGGHVGQHLADIPCAEELFASQYVWGQ